MARRSEFRRLRVAAVVMTFLVIGSIVTVGATGSSMAQKTWDFGDAPDPEYPSTLDSDGARHIGTDQAWLGDAVTAEPDSQQVDADQADDGLDGFVRAAGILSTASDPTSGVEFTVTNNDGPEQLYVNVLFDGNSDGDWDDEDEWILQNDVVNVSPGESRSVRREVALPQTYRSAITITTKKVPNDGNGGPGEETTITRPPAWVRVTVTTKPIDDYNGTGEFAVGETEDHLLPEQERTFRTNWMVLKAKPVPTIMFHDEKRKIGLWCRGPACDDITGFGTGPATSPIPNPGANAPGVGVGAGGPVGPPPSSPSATWPYKGVGTVTITPATEHADWVIPWILRVSGTAQPPSGGLVTDTEEFVTIVVHPPQAIEQHFGDGGGLPKVPPLPKWLFDDVLLNGQTGMKNTKDAVASADSFFDVFFAEMKALEREGGPGCESQGGGDCTVSEERKQQLEQKLQDLEKQSSQLEGQARHLRERLNAYEDFEDDGLTDLIPELQAHLDQVNQLIKQIQQGPRSQAVETQALEDLINWRDDVKAHLDSLKARPDRTDEINQNRQQAGELEDRAATVNAEVKALEERLETIETTDPTLSRFDSNGDQQIGFREVLDAIAAFNEGNEIGNEPVTFQDVLEVIRLFNEGTGGSG